MKKNAGKKLIAKRVEEFEKNKAVLMKKGHGETNIRSNYIDIMFEALGWNMKSHYEVVREFSQRDKSKDSGTKKVDYAFKINGKLKFFIEAKEASVDLENDKHAIYQAKRYAYSSNGKAPIVILTDFEEFRVFNVIKAPLKNNINRELLRKQTMRYTDYLDKWDLLWDTFSRDAVEKGSLDKLIGKIDKNTKTMDVDFLEQITGWREALAKNIAIRNGDLNVDEINESVQRILDRLVFIRNLEDREIESENTLFDKTKISENIYKSIIPLFNSLDKTYNGLLFKKHFSENIIIDDKTIKSIIREMCYPVSPFQFDIIEPEILGRIYEKFLGSKIRLTDSHRAKVEEKIEVRKAGGVYYTPEYIVEYIVKNTVGKKIEGLTPEKIKKIKILDPACGSGSFLIGAYSYLLDYHQKWYAANKTNKADWYKNKDGEIKVTLDKRGDILRNNIFGVDIDKEATEVAIMSLYLKMLDDGFDKSEIDLFFIKGSILPDMIENIKCGNSLIDSKYFDEKLIIDPEEYRKIKPFDWEKEFFEISKKGGFSCIIGNPPYITYSLGHEREKNESIDLLFIKTKWKNSCEYKINSFSLFYELASTIIEPNGMIAYIIPGTILINEKLKCIRKYFIDTKLLLKFIKLDYKVFEDAEMGDCTIIFLGKNETKSVDTYYCNNQNDIYNAEKKTISYENILSLPDFRYFQSPINYIALKQKDNLVALGKIVKFYNGIKSGNNKKFISEKRETNKYLPIIRGRDFFKYSPIFQTHYIFFDKSKLWSNHNENRLSVCPKIIIRQTSDKIIATLDTTGFYPMDTIHMIYEAPINFKVILSIINSKVFNFYYKSLVPETGKAFAEVKITNLKKIQFPKFIDEERSNILIKLVDGIMESFKLFYNATSDTEREQLNKITNIMQNKIDKLVYKLYDLTDAEIKVVESN